MNPNDIPPAYMTDWNGWGIALVAVASVATIAWFLTSRRTLAWVNGSFDDRGTIAGNIAWGVLTLAGLFGLLYLPGAIMRHIPGHGDVGWVVLVAAGAGIALWLVPAATTTYVSYEAALFNRIALWTPIGALAFGTISGLVVDALSRFAHSIPTTIPAALGLIVLVIVLIVAWARSQ